MRMPVFSSPVHPLVECGAGHVAYIGQWTQRGTVKIREFVRADWIAVPSAESAWLEQVRIAVQTILHRGVSPGPVTFVPPAHLVLTKFMKAPRAASSKLEQVVRFEAQQSMPFALEDVAWGYAISGDCGPALEVMLSAAKLEAIEGLLGVLEESGFRPRAVLPPTLALAYAARQALPTSRAQPTLLVEIGARSTTLVLAEAGRFLVRTLAIGGNRVTQQLALEKNCEFAAAEAQKLSAPCADSIAHSVECFATLLTQEITRSIVYFRRQFGIAAPVHFWLSGGGSRLVGLTDLLAARLRLPVERLDLLHAFDIRPSVAAEGVIARGPDLAVLLGATAVMRASTNHVIDLLPPLRCARQAAGRARPWLGAAAALTALALLPPLVQQTKLLTALRARIVAVDAVIAPMREREARNRANADRLAMLQAQIESLHSVLERRASWVGLFADLQDRLTRVEDVWFERLYLSPFPDGGGRLRLAVSGRLLDQMNPLANANPDTQRRVTALLGHLVDSPFISSVEGERFDHRQPGILHFDFVLVTAPDRPL